MSTITIEALEAKHSELGAMIAALKRTAAPTLYRIEEAEIELAAGEQYAGLVLAEDGTPDWHLILLPENAEKVTWQAAMEWAGTLGATLPTRREQALLFANLKDQFEAEWYWSSEAHETNGSYAWYQTFYGGNQSSSHKSYEGRAVAVRRFPA